MRYTCQEILNCVIMTSRETQANEGGDFLWLDLIWLKSKEKVTSNPTAKLHLNHFIHFHTN